MAPLRAAPDPETLAVCDDIKDPGTLDPQREFSEKNHTIVQQIYDGLVRLTPEGKIEPALAESWRRIDEYTLEFTLRRGVSFHNGEPFDADSVRTSILRYLDPAGGFPARGFIETVKDAVVVDSHTVRIITHVPDGLLLNRLAAFVVMVPPRYLAEKGPEAMAYRPVGTGAFRLLAWEQGQRIVLEANPTYWKRGYPKVKRLVFCFLPADKQTKALLDGKIDILTEMPGTYTQKTKANPTTDVLKKETLYAVVGGFNTSRPPLSDKRVRQALNYAIDRRLLIRYDLLGNGRPLASLAMPGESGYSPDLSPYSYNPQKAMALLREAGVSPGFKLKAFIQAQSERTAYILARQLKEVGIELQIEQVASDADVIAKLKQGDWDMTVAGLPNPMAHSLFIPMLLLSSQSPFSIHKDPAFDMMLGKTMGELDYDKQAVLAKELDRFIQEEALCLFAYQRIKTYGLSRRVHFVPYITGMPYFDSTYISDRTTTQTEGK